jgi:small nuclear ribonucleoprotein (snRNP)-like protein
VIVASAVILAALVLLLTVTLARTSSRDRLVRHRMREKVIVTMKSGEAFMGVLTDADGRSFVLRDAKALTDSSARPVPVDGELVLDRAQIDYMQRPGEVM